jgi:hypothetical protein
LSQEFFALKELKIIDAPKDSMFNGEKRRRFIWAATNFRQFFMTGFYKGPRAPSNAQLFMSSCPEMSILGLKNRKKLLRGNTIFKGLSSKALSNPFYEWVWTPGSKVRKFRQVLCNLMAH